MNENKHFKNIIYRSSIYCCIKIFKNKNCNSLTGLEENVFNKLIHKGKLQKLYPGCVIDLPNGGFVFYGKLI
jgi:hypothetical protein